MGMVRDWEERYLRGGGRAQKVSWVQGKLEEDRNKKEKRPQILSL